MNKFVENVRLIYFSNIKESNSRKTFVDIEGIKDVPFEIKRIFYIFGGDRKLVRGKHANRKSQFVLFNISGTSKVRVIDEEKRCKVYDLDSPNKAIYLPEMVWKEMYDFSDNSILMVLTNEYYDKDEYIRNFEDYKREIQYFQKKE